MLVALAVFILWPLAELFVAIQLANAIGVLATIVLLIAGWPLGIWALRSQGRAAGQRLAAAVSEGRAPAREVIDGTLILAGGTLLMIPGFITDVLGICLLLAPTRAIVRPLLVHNLHSRFVMRAARFSSGGSAYDVDSTASDIDQPQLRS